MLGRAALRAFSSAHAYLMLLRIEVTAFHPAASLLREVAPYGDGRTGARTIAPLRQTRLCGPVPRSFRTCARTERAAVSRYPALWSPDLPRYQKIPRLPSLPCIDIVADASQQTDLGATCDNSACRPTTHWISFWQQYMAVKLITLICVRRAYGHRPLLGHAYLTVQSDERICLIGRSGGGRSARVTL